MKWYKDLNNFRPENICEYWIKTRKANIQNTKHPGFYETVGFSLDKTWVYIALSVEAAAIIITVVGGVSRFLLGSGVGYLIGAIVAVVVFVALDYIGMLWHHTPVQDKQEARCKYALIPILGGEEQAIKGRLAEKSSKKSLGIMLIILSAILKLLALFLLGTLGLVVIGVMVILYLLVIYIHIYHTGYWYYAMKLNNRINKQYKLWKKYRIEFSKDDQEKSARHKGEDYDITNKEKEQSTSISSKTKLWEHEDEIINDSNDFMYINEDRYSLVFKKIKNNMYDYELTTKGVFIDYDIIQILSKGKKIDRNLVALYCLQHQQEKISKL